MTTDFAGKTVAVLGLARSGLACAEVLTERGARVRLYDSKPAEELTAAINAARALGLEPQVGGAPIDYAGLDCLITSPGVRKSAPALQEAVARGIPVWSEIEAAYRIAKAPILAITGTNGKTTTTVLLAEMLKAAGIETYMGGNIAAGEIALPLIKAAHLASKDAAIVAEISSFQLEWIDTFRPKVAALLNITPDHGDRQTWEEYVDAKWRIFENLTEADSIVLNETLLGENYGDFLNKLGDTQATWWIFGQKRVEEYECAWYDQESLYMVGKSQFEAWRSDSPYLCRRTQVRLPGPHNVENIMAAAAMATAFGVDIEPIRQVATTFTGVVHRLEYVGTRDGVKYVNNSMCTNVAAFEKSLAALPEPKVVIMGGVFKGSPDELPSLARAVAENNVRALMLIGRSAPELEAAVRAEGYEAIHRAGSLTEAVAQSRSLAASGDTVLLAPACASFDMFRDFEDRGDQFKIAVRDLAG